MFTWILPLTQIVFLTLILLPLFYIVYKVRNHRLFDLFGFILVIIGYVLIHHKFVFGHQYAFHDTFWTLHVFFSVIEQWIRSGFSIGWNPFMNGGEPLYLYSNIFLYAELFVISFLNKLIFNLPSEQLVNLFFTYLFLSYFTFSFILFSAIFRKSTIVFFSFTVLVFSGITQTTMAVPSLIYLHLTPLVLLSLYLFLIKRDIHYLFFLGFLICISANHYIPNYIILVVTFFTFSWYLSKFIVSKFILKSRTVDVIIPPGMNKLFLILIIFSSIMVALPVLYVFSETTAYISPIRGGKLGEVKHFTEENSNQPSGFHPLHRYKYLLDMPVDGAYLSNSIHDKLGYHHSVSYIGSIALLFFLLAFVVKKKGMDKIILSSFIVTLAIIVYFSLKNNFLWLFLTDNIPLFLIRHIYPLANVTTLLIIIISTYGFMYVIQSQKMRYATIVITLILSAYPVIKYAQYQNELPINLAPFKYPYERSLYSQRITPLAFDTTPLILKQAAATHPIEDFTLFRKDEYDKLLKTRPNMAVGNLFSFAPKLKNDVSSVTRYDMKYIRVKYIRDNNPNHLQLKAFIPQDGYLIRKENFHTGWSVKVNNIETPIEKYAGVFQAVKVSRGKVVVDFEFKSLYYLLLWLHIVFVFVGYFIFFYYLINSNHSE